MAPLFCNFFCHQAAKRSFIVKRVMVVWYSVKALKVLSSELTVFSLEKELSCSTTHDYSVVQCFLDLW